VKEKIVAVQGETKNEAVFYGDCFHAAGVEFYLQKVVADFSAVNFLKAGIFYA
jgi:hypothetical protein